MTIELVIVLSIVAHLVGDYCIQNDWMASKKTTQWWPAIVHGVTYALPFLFLTHSLAALLVIAGTHIVIDRFRLAKYIVWAKNQLAPKGSRYAWNSEATDRATGALKAAPAWMSVWLMIILDNTLHILLNVLALVFLGQVWVLF